MNDLLCDLYDKDCRDKTSAADRLEQLVSMYSGNFNILDDDMAIDEFLDLLVQTGDGVTLLHTPDNIHVDGCGPIARRDVDALCVGIIDDHVADSDVVPDLTNLLEFQLSLCKMIHNGSRRIVEVPTIQYTKPLVAKESKMVHANDYVKACLGRNVDFVSPIGVVARVLETSSVGTYDRDNIPIDKIRSSRVLMIYDCTQEELVKYTELGIKVICTRFSPFLPVSVRYVKEIEYDGRHVKGLVYMSRRTKRFFNWDPDGWYCYTPRAWATWLRIPISRLHNEFLAYEWITNFDLEYKSIEVNFFPYLVGVTYMDRLLTGTSVAEIGLYEARNINRPVEVRAGGTLLATKLALHRIDKQPYGISCGATYSLGGVVKTITFETIGLFPTCRDVYHYRGDYYVQMFGEDIFFSDESLRDDYKYSVTMSVVNSPANIYCSLTNVVYLTDACGIASMYRSYGYEAYVDQVMGDNYVTIHDDNYKDKNKSEYQLEQTQFDEIVF